MVYLFIVICIYMYSLLFGYLLLFGHYLGRLKKRGEDLRPPP